MVVQALEHRVNSNGRIVVDREVAIDLDAKLAKRIHARSIVREFRIEDALLRNPFNIPPVPPTKEKGVRPAENLYLLQIIERAVVLNVVANAIDEEISCGANSLNTTASRWPHPWTCLLQAYS